jgi:osmotically-inducible protein OsmY
MADFGNRWRGERDYDQPDQDRDDRRRYASGWGREDYRAHGRPLPGRHSGERWGREDYGRNIESAGRDQDYETTRGDRGRSGSGYEGYGYGRAGYDDRRDDWRRRDDEYGRRNYGRGYGGGYGYGGSGYEGAQDRDYDYPDYRGRERERGGYGYGGVGREGYSGGSYGQEDYGYGGDGGRRVRGYRSGGREDRGWWDRASDEVASWFGDDDAERRRRMDETRQGPHRGRGPRGYTRSDDRIHEDLCDRLSYDPFIDASDVEVTVSGGEVTLNGTVDDRWVKRHAEDIAEEVYGVTHVQNNLRVRQGTGTGVGTGGAGAAVNTAMGATSGATTSGTGSTTNTADNTRQRQKTES